MTLSLCQVLVIAIFINCGVSVDFDSVSPPTDITIQVLLQELQTAQLPVPCFPSNSNASRSNRLARSTSTQPRPRETELNQKEQLRKTKEKRELQYEGLTTGSITRFEAKHLFQNGVDSFEALTRNVSFAKKYLVELNRKLYNDGVLPSAGYEFLAWFDNIHTKSLTIIDADLDILANAIESKFNEWKIPVEVMYGDVPASIKIPSFKTEQKYRVTCLTFEAVNNSQGVVVEVRAKRLNTSVVLVPNKNGKPVHFEKLDPVDSSLPFNMIRKNHIIANFTIEELHINAKLTKTFWKDIGLPSKAQNVLLNESFLYENFEEIVRQNDEDLLKHVIKPSTAEDEEGKASGACSSVNGSRNGANITENCAIFLNPNGEVVSIRPDEFVEEYRKANTLGKVKITTLAKNNMDKVETDGGNELERKTMNQLIQLEDKKSHIASADAVISLQNVNMKQGRNKLMQRDLASTVGDFDKRLSTQKSNVKLSPSKIAEKLSSLSTSKSTQALSRSLATGTSEAIGNIFLSKTVINGIVTGDTTSLAIVGSRVGYAVTITEGAAWAGVKYFGSASKVGKSAKVIGEVAGPIGVAADVGLSVYSLTKSIQRLKSADNKYDRNDAIIDIVSESVSIAVTSTVTVLSAVFPPFAPIFAAIGAVIDLLNKIAVAIFKAANEVARINSKIPLSASEKEYVFNSRFMDWFGTRQKDYLEFLVEEQAANNMAVQYNLRFLQANPSILGIVFPSRTLSYDGGCRFTKRHCALKILWGCTRWENTETKGTGCDRNRPCGGYHSCTDYRTNINRGYNEFKCICSGSRTTFGYPRQDSTIDFRTTKRLFWERAVPEDIKDATFKCKPGSTDFLDYKVHQENARYDYLCVNAIAIMQPRPTVGQSMVFNLEDGTDRVYLSSGDYTPNIFRVGNAGYKEFYGGSGKNEFLLDGSCTNSLRGALHGGRSEMDAVTLSSSCYRGGTVNMNFTRGTLTTADTSKVNFQFYSIEVVNGRENEGDVVTVNCQTKKVALRGGAISRRDVVTIPSSTSCVYNMTALAGSYTTIESAARRGTVSVLVDRPWRSAVANLDVHPESSLKLTVIFSSTSSSQVTVTPVTDRTQTISQVVIRKPSTGDDINLRLNFNYHPRPYPQQAIYFKENVAESPYSFLLLSPSTTPLFYHTLSTTSTRYPSRVGNPYMENIFQITGPNWSVTGGEKDDVFLLNSASVSLIDGRGGVDTLQLDASFKQSMTINLAENRLFKNIENIYGVPGYPLRVHCACSTKLVVPQGGSRTAADTIYVPVGSCPQRNLQIQAKGTSYVNIAADVSNSSRITVVATASGLSSIPLQFELVTTVAPHSIAELLVALELTHKNWTARPATRSSNSQSVTFKLEGTNNEHTIFNLKDSNQENEPYLTAPYIQISKINSTEIPGQLVLERETLIPKVFYQLSNLTATKNGSNVIEGFLGISNMFLVSGGTTWQMTGGNAKDVFTISGSALVERLAVNGGGGSENTLILESESKRVSSLAQAAASTYEVNLQTEELGFSNTTTKGIVKNIQHILGRVNEADEIHTNCHTKTVNGRQGGGKGQEDLIMISGLGCQKAQQTEIVVGKFTKVENTAANGTFIYYVADPLTIDLELRPTESNLHQVEFGVNSWEHIQNVKFDEKLDTLGIQFSDGDTDRVQLFKMYRANKSEGYTNPIIDFHQAGSQVTSDIRVGKDGIVAATFMIHEKGLQQNVFGLPVDINRFLVNITKGNEDVDEGGRCIHGSSSAEANQFWLFQLNSTLDILDGGGACVQPNSDGSFVCTNYLHFAEIFQKGQPVEISLGDDNGFIESDGKLLVSRLKNIHEVRGRNGEEEKDKVTISSCAIRQVSEVEEVVIKLSKGCSMELIIEIENDTRVLFEDKIELRSENASEWLHSTFHYRFKTPRSFDINGSSELAWLGPTHNYYLPFSIDELEALSFDLESEQLHYTINGEEYFHTMILGSNFDEQFYSQPVLITQDAFKINVVRDGSILLALGAGSSFTSEKVRSQVVPGFETVAKKLGVSIIMQTDTQFVYVGHGDLEGDRNVLQNVGYSESHLVGGGANDTIYEVGELIYNVFIYPGFEVVHNESNTTNATKQTIDFTDIVVPIRTLTGTKYVPKVNRQGGDLVISMEGYMDKYPGMVRIVNGTMEHVASRIQLLLNNAIMDFVPVYNTTTPTTNVEEETEEEHEANRTISYYPQQTECKIRPRPILIPGGSVYSIAGEDLEDEHYIQLEPEVRGGSNSTFQLARNGTDLYFTNLMSDNNEHNVEITTLIISDYFDGGEEDSINFQNQTQRNSSNNLAQVTVSLPGLHLLLNNSQIVNLQGNLQISHNNRANIQVTNTMPQIREWATLLQEVEAGIVETAPEIDDNH